MTRVSDGVTAPRCDGWFLSAQALRLCLDAREHGGFALDIAIEAAL
jgi:hypothetical protein